jgi:glutaredoxin
MTPRLTLYSRRDCCLCDEMKAVIKAVAAKIAIDLEEIDVDSAAPLQQQFGNEVPVLFIDGRKAFKYRLTAANLAKKLRRNHSPLFDRWARIIGR